MINSSKISILYVGNKLSHYGYAMSVIEELGYRLEQLRFKVFYAGTKRNKFLRLAEILWKSSLLNRKVNYILIDTYSTSAFWYAYLTGLVARLTGTKYIPILHGGDLPSRLMKSKKACNALFSNSFTNVAVSGYLSYEFERARYKTIVIPNSIDISKYTFRLRERPRPKLLWVRSFHRQYNPQMAADVVKELLKSYPEAELCMVGPDKDGSMQDFRNYIDTRGIGDQVRITGLLKKEEWIKLSEDYDFFINTTNVDNTPVSVIEALAMGLAVISTDPGGIPFLLTDNLDSCLVSCGNAVIMAEKIDGLIKHPSVYNQIVTNGRELAENFDWLKIKQKWLDLLD